MNRLLTSQEIRSLPRSALERFQDEKFASYVRHVLLPGSRYYRELFRSRGVTADAIRSIRDWQRAGLPLVRKSDYRARVPDFLLTPASEREGLEHYLRFCGEAGDLDNLVEVARLRRLTATVKTATLPSSLVATALAVGEPEAAAEYVFGVAGAFLTGGTSGEPTPVYYSRLDRDLFTIANARHASVAASWLDARGERIVAANLYPHAAHQAWWVLNWGLESTAHCVIGLSGGGVTPTERIVELLSMFGVTLITGMPSYVRNRLVPGIVAAAREGRRFARRMVVSLGAEAVPDAVRREIAADLATVGVEETWVIGAYGASELRFLPFTECPGNQGYHSMAPDLAAARTVRLRSADDWEFAEPGEEGVLAVFPLDGTGTALVGFVLGDLTTLATTACPGCGGEMERLLGLRRESDTEVQMRLMGVVEGKIRGATVNLGDLRHQLLKLEGVQEVQIVVERRDAQDPASQDVLRIRVAVREGVDRASAADLVATVASTTKRLTEVRPDVETVSLGDLQAGSLKFKAIIDARAV